MRTHLSTFVDPAEALMGCLDGGPTVAGIVPRGYPRYLRIFGPIGLPSGDGPDPLVIEVSWATICEQLGVAYTPNVLWERDIVAADPRIAAAFTPGFGSGDTGLVERVNHILHAHETEDRSWHFATWPGYGIVENPKPVWLPSHHHGSLEMSVFERWNEASAPAELPLVPRRVDRGTLLTAFFDHVSSLPDGAPPEPQGEVPMYWWPDGADWVLGQALYGRSLYLACGDEIADAMLAAPRIEAIDVSASDEAEYEE